MTIHQLYDGGAANSNLSRMQYPSAAFSATDPTLGKISVAQHYGSPWAVMRKILDFKNDYVLRNYFTNNVVAQSDVFNLLVLPAKTLLVAAFVEVERGTEAVGAPLSPPIANAPTTATTGGTLAAGTYFYKITALGTTGETLGSNEVSVTTTGSTSANTVTWNAVTGATGYKVYRGTGAGQESVFYSPGNVLTYTDTNAASTPGTPPISNTAVAAGPALTMTFGSAAGMTLGGSAVDCTALSANCTAPNGTWKNGTGGGVLSLATAQYIGTQPDIVQATLTSLGLASLAGFGNLRLNVSALIVQANEYPATNF